MKQEENNSQSQIRHELSKFINLLQTDFQQSIQDSPNDTRNVYEGSLKKKLSIIFSASEPESSSLDKQNSNPSANRSFQSTSKIFQGSSYQSIIAHLLTTNLTPLQLKTVEKIKGCIEEIIGENERLSAQVSKLQAEVCSQKKANDQILNVLMKLDHQEKELWNNYNLMSTKHQELVEKHKVLEGQCQKLNQSVFSLQNDNDFMKKLIFHANENYENLERKCRQLEKDQAQHQKGQIYTDRKSIIKKSSTDHLLKSAKTKKNGYSPSHSELGRTPSPDRFQDVYRKMIIRTLKFKGKGHH